MIAPTIAPLTNSTYSMSAQQARSGPTIANQVGGAIGNAASNVGHAAMDATTALFGEMLWRWIQYMFPTFANFLVDVFPNKFQRTIGMLNN